MILRGELGRSMKKNKEKRKRKLALKEKIRQKEIEAQIMCAKSYAKELKENATEAELRFMEIAKRKGLDLAFQVPIRIKEVFNEKTGKMGYSI